MDIAAILDDAIDLEEQERLTEALLRFEQVLAADPRNTIARAGALGARAALACNAGRHSEAIALASDALAASTYDLRAQTVRAKAYAALGRHHEALADVLKVLAFAPEFPEALATRGTSFLALGETEAGVSDLDAAAGLKPDIRFILGQALHFSMQICRWEGWRDRLEALLQAVDVGRPATRPFWLLSLPSTPQQQYKAAATYFAGVSAEPSALPPAKASEKIRIGYFSTDFCAHATSHLMAGMLEAHDRSRFEIVGFAVGGRMDAIRMQIAKSMDRLVACEDRSDADIVDLARGAHLDIAVDLNVYTGRQPAIFGRRIAPLQVNFLGYPGTAGAPCYDYVIGDSVLTPFEHRAHFSERIVQLPHCYQPNALSRYGALRTPTRAALGLPASGVVFCCFNDGFKILPDVFDVWMRLLKAVEGSVLWLLENSALAARNLRAEAAKRGVAPERLVFAQRAPIGAHLARHGAADLFLDTWPYNAHTTASDALWGGVPILTCEGDTFASRVAASALTAVGLPELITHSLADYEARALALARDPAALAALKQRLWRNRTAAPLFDTLRYTRNIERAFETMWTRHMAGYAPQEFAVAEMQ
jgi:predicted O-linked N-acetylglucosamine transferase (SPINDLY family)